jgi:hypothetical protein
MLMMPHHTSHVTDVATIGSTQGCGVDHGYGVGCSGTLGGHLESPGELGRKPWLKLGESHSLMLKES